MSNDDSKARACRALDVSVQLNSGRVRVIRGDKAFMHTVLRTRPVRILYLYPRSHHTSHYQIIRPHTQLLPPSSPANTASSTMSSPKTTVLVTGGNNGIGLAACQLFAAQPNYHCIMASRSLEKGQKALASIKSSNISVVQLDITSDASIAAAVKEVEAKHSRLDVLVNNAGVCPTELTRDVLRECIDTNAISPGLVTQAFKSLLLKSQGTPRVVYVSSELGSISRRCDPKNVAYEAEYKAYRMSKAALNMLVACDSWEFGGKMMVWAYCPGYVVTDLAGERESKEKAGVAKSPEWSARGLLRIVEGERDEEAGRFVHDERVGEVYDW